MTRPVHAGAAGIVTLAAVAAAALAPAPEGLALAAAGILALIAAWRAWSTVKPVLLAVPFSVALAVLLAVTREGGAALDVAGVTFHARGFTEGVVAGARFAVAFGAGLWATRATRPGDALRLFRRTPRLALAIATVARLAPALATDYHAVAESRRLRGALPAGRAARVLASGRLFPPLLVRAARRGLATDEALRAAGYDAHAPRVVYGRRSWHALDIVVAAFACLVAGTAIAAGFA